MPGTKTTTSIGEAVISSQSHNSIRLDTPPYLILILNELSYPGWNAYGWSTTRVAGQLPVQAIEISPGITKWSFGLSRIP